MDYQDPGMTGRIQSAPIPTPTLSPIQQACQNLEHVSEQLNNLRIQMHERLTPIMSGGVSQEAKPSTDCQPRGESNMFHAITESTDKMSVDIGVMFSYLDRLEL